MNNSHDSIVHNDILSANEKQLRAVQPQYHVWVMANAGSGKTTVLVKRYLCLLLQGHDLKSILCLTFTRTGANIMLERIYHTVQRWLFMSDKELEDDLGKILLPTDITQDVLNKARRLFGLIIESPTDLKVQTIHAFAETLLRHFPLEVNIAPDFTIIEEQEVHTLMQQALDALVVSDDKDVLLANDVLTSYGVDRSKLFTTYIQVMMTRFDRDPDYIRHFIIAYYKKNHNNFHVRQSIETYCQAVLSCSLLCSVPWNDIYKTLCVEHPEKKEFKKACLHQLSESLSAKEKFDILKILFLTKQDNQPKKSPLPKKIMLEYDVLTNVGEYVSECYQYVCAIEHYQLNDACAVVADFCMQEYDKRKKYSHYLDYNDLVSKLYFFLRRFIEQKKWIFEKFHYHVEHLLIDEAQDNSYLQWDIIELLSRHFFTYPHKDVLSQNSSFRQQKNSLFVVGDNKQSIFSFQGADPEAFLLWRSKLKQKSQDASQGFINEDFTVSFRSANFLLSFVDTLFSKNTYTKILSQHTGFHRNARIELWPLCVTKKRQSDYKTHNCIDKKTFDKDFFFPDEYTESSDSGEQQLAEKIADTIKHWIKHGLPEPFKGKKPVLSEIMILLRKRGTAMININKALQKRGIPVSGLDRFFLTQDLIIKDLIALARWALFPADDLSLAEILKGCFIGMTEEELMTMCTQRNTQTLWQYICHINHNSERLRSICDYLKDVIVKAQENSVYDFYIYVLYADFVGKKKGMEIIEEYFGTLSIESIDIFLEQAYHYDQVNTDGMQGFLCKMENTNIEVKRQTHHEHDAVRVLTIHGAKGQEADIVIMADAYHEPVSIKSKVYQYTQKHDDGTYKESYALCSMKTNKRSPLDEEVVNYVRDKEKEESYRLLYVALTRARDMLVICGSKNTKDMKDSWYEMIKEHMHDFAKEDNNTSMAKPYSDDEPIIRTYSCDVLSDNRTSVFHDNHSQSHTSYGDEIWKDISSQKTCEAYPVSLLPMDFPSSSDDAMLQEKYYDKKILRQDGVLERVEKNIPIFQYTGVSAKQKGIMSHALLESLPVIKPHLREQEILHYIQGKLPDIPKHVQFHWAKQLKNVLLHPLLIKAFSPSSCKQIFSEIPVMGVQYDDKGKINKQLSARIDALIVDENDVWIIDYKHIDAVVPDIFDVPQQYVYQMQCYGRFMNQIFPNHRKYLWLVYIEGAKVIEIPFHPLLISE